MAVRDGVATPLFDAPARGAVSPSPSLLVETRACGLGEWQTRAIPGQVLTMFLRPGAVLHAAGRGPVSRIPIAARSVVFSLRQREESLRWLLPAEIISIGLDDAMLAQAAQARGDDDRFELLAHPGVRDERLESLLYALYLEQAGGYAAGRLFVDGIEQAVCALLVGRYNAYAPRPVASQGGLPSWCARRVADYIEAHLDRPISLPDLAACAGFSQAHFSRLFHTSFGAAPHQFVLRRRMARARELLLQRRHSVLEIALACGFQNAQHFSRTFHRLTGVPPSRFRHDDAP